MKVSPYTYAVPWFTAASADRVMAEPVRGTAVGSGQTPMCNALIQSGVLSTGAQLASPEDSQEASQRVLKLLIYLGSVKS